MENLGTGTRIGRVTCSPQVKKKPVSRQREWEGRKKRGMRKRRGSGGGLGSRSRGVFRKGRESSSRGSRRFSLENGG